MLSPQQHDHHYYYCYHHVLLKIDHLHFLVMVTSASGSTGLKSKERSNPEPPRRTTYRATRKHLTFMAKRVRTDGHLRREEYDALERQAEAHDPRAFDPTATAGVFTKAPQAELKERRVVKIKRKRVVPAPPPPTTTTTSSSSSSSSSSANPFAAFSMATPAATTTANPFATFSMAATTTAATTTTTTTTTVQPPPPPPPTVTLSTTTHPFVMDTFRKRIPAIMDDTAQRLSGNSDAFPTGCWQPLRATMASSVSTRQPLVLLVDRPENQTWNNCLQPLVLAGKTMQDIDTFFLENLVYRYMLDASGFWDSHFDPFVFHKEEALAQALGGTFSQVAALRSAFYAVTPLLAATESPSSSSSSAPASSASPAPPRLTYGAFRAILLLDLWGNRADLSLSGGKKIHDKESNATGTTLLADDIKQCWSSPTFQSGARKDLHVSIVLDNCGLELCTDLILSEMLLVSGVAKTVTLYAKQHPIFVSDALPKDVHHHVQMLSQWKGTNKCIDLLPLIQSKRLIVTSHAFFNSGHPCKAMPTAAPDLFNALKGQDLIVFKGDANYRRLMGEQTWNETASFDQVVSYLPSPALAIRTLKYPLSCGASGSSIGAAKDLYGPNEWNCIGKCGVVHFSGGAKAQ